MPNKQAAIKDLRKNKKHVIKNRAAKRSIKELLKDINKQLASGKIDEKMLKDIVSKLDRAVNKKIIKKNTAARKKSRLFKKLKTVKK